MLSSVLAALASRGVQQPIGQPVPADDAAFVARKGAAKIAFRVLRRSAELAASGQRRSERAAIDPAWKHALWIHAEAPQIGDALMDLAPRSLLAARGIAVDLLAPPGIAALFAGDHGFGRVLVDEAAIAEGGYDFVVTDSRSAKALAAKRRRLAGLPWVSIKGDYLGHDFHRGLLATRRLGELLGAGLDAHEECRHSRQKLCLDPPAAGDRPRRVALALGGVRSERSYAHWAEVAAGLCRAGATQLLLLGSANAKAARDDVVRRLAGQRADVLDLVDRTDLHGTWRALHDASLVVAADGGLMHLALTTPAPVLALFDAGIDPAWRLPLDFAGASLRAAGRDVSLIEAGHVVDRALALLSPRAQPLSRLRRPSP